MTQPSKKQSSAHQPEQNQPLSKEQIDAIRRQTLGLDPKSPDASGAEPGKTGGSSHQNDATPPTDTHRDQRMNNTRMAHGHEHSTDDQIGYGKPPKHSQFKPGQSGNPKGRPRTLGSNPHRRFAKSGQLGDEGPDLTPAQKLLLSEGKRMIGITDNGRSTHISAEQATARSRYAEAIKGKPLAQSTLYRDLKEAEAAMRDRRTILNAVWREYSKQAWNVIEAIEAGQSDEPEPLPHPADIILSDEHDPRFCGPFTYEEWIQTEARKSLREHLFLEHIYCERYGMAGPGEDERFQAHVEAGGLDVSAYDTSLMTGAWFAIELLQQNLPPRLRWTLTEVMMVDLRLNRGTRRDLEKRLTASRKKHRIPLPRGCFYHSAAFEISLHQFSIEAARYLIELFDNAKHEAALRGHPEWTVEPPIGDPHELLAMMEAHDLNHERLINSTIERKRKAA